MKTLFYLAGLLSITLISSLSSFKPLAFAATTEPCTLEAYGKCDPYVPGTIIVVPGNKPITVLSSWPHSPAEKAGICSGDQILAINGISGSENTTVRSGVKVEFSLKPATLFESFLPNCWKTARPLIRVHLSITECNFIGMNPNTDKPGII